MASYGRGLKNTATLYTRGLLLRSHSQKLVDTVFPALPSSSSSTSRYSSSSSSAKLQLPEYRNTRNPIPELNKTTARETRKKMPLPIAPEDEEPMDPDVFLLKVLKKELKKAMKIIEKYEVDIKGSFYPFEIVPTEGTSELTLRRQMGDEEILVKCVLEIEEPEDYEYLLEENLDELKTIQHLKINVQIMKASFGDETRFQLMCDYMGQTIEIEEIVYLDKSAYVEDDYPYLGPVFSDLSARMQESFYELMKRRGINASLADLVMDHLASKYQEEYLEWVHKIRSFLKRKGGED